ncbi:MAG: hypothetical protein JWN73_1647 [Betaproteobacteria bacterium]|nr:hypothetical protein [Betaproteobacteria bacterium]
MGTSALTVGIGVVFLCIVAYSLAGGRTVSKQSRGWIYREEEPGKYWSAVVSYAIAALLFFAVAWHWHARGPA